MAIICFAEKYAEAVERITAALHPEKIYLFGSYTWGVPTPDSDIDLFVIVRDSISRHITVPESLIAPCEVSNSRLR